MGTAHRVTGYQLLGSNVPGVSPVSRNRAEISTFKYVPHKRNQKKGAQWEFNGDMGKPMSLIQYFGISTKAKQFDIVYECV